MNPPPILYIGVAAPLVEASYLWLVEIPPCDDEKAKREKLLAFPKNRIGAYGLKLENGSALAFRTGAQIPRKRVKAEIEAWSGTPPQRISGFEHPVPPLDHRKALAELMETLEHQPIQVVSRVGVTRQTLQRDLAELRPALVLLDCHGTEEGCLMLEDGRGQADMVPGDSLFSILQPRPTVLFLAACYSGTVLKRAKDAADWTKTAIVHIASPCEV